MKKITFTLIIITIFFSLVISLYLLYYKFTISNSIELAGKYCDNKEYERSLDQIEFVLLRQPKNIPANELYRKILAKINEERDLLDAKLALEKQEDREWKDTVLKRIADLERKMNKQQVERITNNNYYKSDNPVVKKETPAIDNTEENNKLKKIDGYINDGKNAFFKKEYARAKISFLKALNIDKNHPEALVYLGGSMFYENPKDQSIMKENNELIVRGLNIDGDIWIGHKFLAQIYEGHEKNSDAINEYSLALELKPDDEETNILLAKLRLKLDDTDKAEEGFNRAKNINKDSVMATYYLALAKYENGDRDGAKKLLRELVTSTPNFFSGYLMLGDISSENKEYDDAVKYYETAIKINDKYEAYQGLADCYFDMKKYYRSTENYKLAVKKNPFITEKDKEKISIANERLAIIELGNDKIPGAGEYAEKSFEYGRKSRDVYYIMALYKSYFNFDEDAIGLYEKSLELDPEYSDSYAGIARSFLKINNNNLAVKYADKGLSMNDKNYKLYLVKADALKNLGEYDRAVSEYEQSIKLKSPEKQTLLKTGICYKKMNDYEKSFGYFLKAIEMDKTYYDSYLELGESYYSAGKYLDAKNCLDEIIRKKPNYERRSEVNKLLNQIKKKT